MATHQAEIKRLAEERDWHMGRVAKLQDTLRSIREEYSTAIRQIIPVASNDQWPDRWQPHVGRMMQIEALISELKDTAGKFGNTCVYITGLTWGAVALNYQAEDQKHYGCPDCVRGKIDGAVCPTCLGTNRCTKALSADPANYGDCAMTSPSNTEDVGTLIARLREAKGADRRLDAEIACLARFTNHRPSEPDDFDGQFGYRPGDIKCKDGFLMSDSYTASIDAALTLIPAGWSWSCNADENRKHSTAILGRSYPTNANASAEHSSPAIALCLAALEARRQAP